MALAVTVSALAFAVYAATACRTIFSGDSAELTTAAICFGVPHPPGYPLYTLATALWVRLFPAACQAFAANLASSLHGALAVGLSLLLFHRLGAGPAGSVLGAEVLALGSTFWGQAVAAEVYALDIALLVVALHALLSASSASRRLPSLLAGLAIGLWVGHRVINLVYLPALLLIAWRRGRASRFPLRPLPALGGLAAAALPLLYLPLASARHPALDIGSPDSWHRFWSVVTCSPYARHVAGGMGLAWGRLVAFARALPLEVGVGAPLALAAVWGVRRKRVAAAPVNGLIALLLASAVIASRYNVLDAEVFFLPGIWAIAALAALGASTLGNRTVILAALAVGLLPGFLNLAANDLRNERSTHRFARDLLASAPTNAVLFVYGDTAAHALWYAQDVESTRRDVLVISLGHFSDWYFEQLRERHPGDPWPASSPDAAPEQVLSRLLQALGSCRPISFAMDPGPFVRLGPASWWEARTVIPRGLLLEVLPKDPPPDRAARAELDLAFWRDEETCRGPLRRRADLETKLIRLDCATAALRCADFLARQQLRQEAVTLYRRIPALDPQPLEREAELAFRGIGQSRPQPRLVERAARCLSELEGR